MGSVIDGWVRSLHESSPHWLEGHGPSEMTWVAMDGGPAHRDRAILFLFPRGRRYPSLVVKAAFSPREARYLAGEAEALSAIREGVPRDLADTMPEVLTAQQWGPAFVVVVTALRGRRWLVPDLAGESSLVGRRVLRRFLRLGFEWSDRLQRSTRAEDDQGGEGLAKVVEDFVARFAIEDWHHEVGGEFAESLLRADVQWQAAWQHGALEFENALVRGRQLLMVDWEHAGPDYQPWFDVAYAPYALVQVARRQAASASFLELTGRVLSRRHWVGRMVAEEMERCWDHPLPLGWAVALANMVSALRRPRAGRPASADLAFALLGDGVVQAELDWLATAR